MEIQITMPNSHTEFEFGTNVHFKGNAELPIVKVELWADDRWFLGETEVSGGSWAFSYSFNTSGIRSIYAKGFDDDHGFIEADTIWIVLKSLSEIDVDMKLTNNFTLGEMIFSQTAQFKGIDNTPTQLEISRLKNLCEQILQPARNALGPLRITSGFRSESLNNYVGGVPTSAHRLGHAADVIPTSGDTRALAKWVVDNCPFDQVILEYGTLARPSWIHVSADPTRNRSQVLRATSAGTTIISI